MSTAPPAFDLAKLDAILAVCAAKGERKDLAGREADFVRRAGGFAYAWNEAVGEEDWNDWNGALVGRGPILEERGAEPADPALPYAELAPLLERGPFARSLVAGHPATPDAVLTRLREDGDPFVQRALARRGVDLERLAASKDRETREEVALHPSTPAASQVLLASDAQMEVRYRLAKRAVLAPEARAVLARDELMSSALAKRADATVEDLRRYAKTALSNDALKFLARHAETPDDILALLKARGVKWLSDIIEGRKPRKTV